jgi:hypothetical protein
LANAKFREYSSKFSFLPYKKNLKKIISEKFRHLFLKLLFCQPCPRTTVSTLATLTHDPTTFTRPTPPTPINTQVNHSIKWNTLNYATLPNYSNHNPTPFPTYTFTLPPKFPFKYNYYTDGSFKPPKQIGVNLWKAETTAYGVSNPIKDLQIS